ncbi:DUF3048 domain-containing protein [Clostridium formicaceticum]|uniref:Lipoprotein YerB n=1 Tax=Clostridium formicaceticum TaxID=1497 RepID=A0AAC9RMS3_9CLOT|nr:DUF3048 domain-containing protein [Clostridium formicaceticum]AOY77552.1 hypothetical protein BJL90_17845 [Clostridium formicaceticum]ARE88128.1 Putative lipoprotein YerB precursor [Clostridium formicaceticum]
MDGRKIIIAVLIMSFIVTITGCGKKTDVGEDLEDQPTVEIEVEKVEEVSYEGLAINPLTGIWIDEEAAQRRPVAVMVNNIKVALPQSGISEADIMYETLAEGNITRLVAVFQDFDTKKIGPVRSTRHYYLNLAFDHDAIFVHHGGSPQAFEDIKNLKPANLNSLSGLETIMAWRDPVRSKQRGMYEHSLYTSAEGIMKAWKSVGYREERREDLQPKFNFSEEEWTPQGEKAELVTVPFSNEYISTFQYDAATQQYKRYQFGKPHIDENNNQQLESKNIIIQFTNIKVIPGDAEGRRDIQLIGSGKGLYISNGMATPITWSKGAYNTATQFKDASGNPLKMNKGKTWVCIFPNNKEVVLE